MFRAVVFDIGQTLIEYNKPLNWSKSYRPALERAAAACNINLSEQDYKQVIDVLTIYNTRVNPREYEISSYEIFSNIFKRLDLCLDVLVQFKREFYLFFNNETCVYDDVPSVLRQLKGSGLILATLSDVAYGMDNEFALADIEQIKSYVDFPLTSNDVGFRKPATNGLNLLSEKTDVQLSEMVMVGDEEKDIICANNAGAYSVLINRDFKVKDFGQRSTIHSMFELPEIILKEF